MNEPDEIIKRQWGKGRIRGGRHAFRLAMVMREVKAHFPWGARVLDAGCGDGTLSIELIGTGYDVSAVDASQKCVARLKESLSTFVIPGDGSFSGASVADLAALPFPDSSFDAAVSGEVLEHLEDDRSAVAEFFRVLRPGGTCIVTVPANPDLFGIEDEWAGHVRRYEKDGLQKMFEKAGFATVELYHWGWPVTWLYNRLLFQRWLKGKLSGGGDPDESGEGGGLATNPVVMALMYAAFSLDRLFTWLPFGIGLVGVFRKPE